MYPPIAYWCNCLCGLIFTCLLICSGLWCLRNPLTAVSWSPLQSSSCFMAWSCRFRTWEESASRFSFLREITLSPTTPTAFAHAPSRRCCSAWEAATKVCVVSWCLSLNLCCCLWTQVSLTLMFQMLQTIKHSRKSLPLSQFHHPTPFNILCPPSSQSQEQARSNKHADKRRSILEHVSTSV